MAFFFSWNVWFFQFFRDFFRFRAKIYFWEKLISVPCSTANEFATKHKITTQRLLTRQLFCLQNILLSLLNLKFTSCHAKFHQSNTKRSIHCQNFIYSWQSTFDWNRNWNFDLLLINNCTAIRIKWNQNFVFCEEKFCDFLKCLEKQFFFFSSNEGNMKVYKLLSTVSTRFSKATENMKRNLSFQTIHLKVMTWSLRNDL